MAALEAITLPKKRMNTYGKAARRRMPDYGSFTVAPQSRTPERQRSEPIPPTSSGPKKLKNIPRMAFSRTPTPVSPTSVDVFDVPSSEDEGHSSAQKLVHKPPPRSITRKNVHKVPVGQKPVDFVPEVLESRKRIKLSPAPLLQQRPTPAKVPPKRAAPTTTKNGFKQVPKTLGLGQTGIMVTRPKLLVPSRKVERLRSPPKVVSLSVATISETLPLEPSRPDMMDVDLTSEAMSPRGLRMWQDLLESDQAAEVGIGSRIVKSSPQPASRALFKPAGISKQKSPNNNLRRRLIDTLVEQTVPVDNMDEDDGDVGDQESPSKASPDPGFLNAAGVTKAHSAVPEQLVSTQPSTSQSTQIAGPKFTYSKQRSMLAEEDFMSQLAVDLPSQPGLPQGGKRPRRGSIPALTPLQSYHDEEEEEPGAGVAAIRSVHELRKAGANNRFMDEVEDLLDRIGKPATPASSVRRSGLIDLMGKMKDKNFVRQFRSGGLELRLFVSLGHETDTVAGYLMVSILTMILVDTSMPHIVEHLRRQGIARLLIRMLESKVDIVALSKERKTNMSRMAQSLLLGHHQYLVNTPIWEEIEPQLISPRTIALKCLELMVRQTRESGNSSDIMSKELTTKLFQIMNAASEESSWDLPQGKEAIDFYLALSALESHSIAARTARDESIWITSYLPVVADTLQVALSRPIDDFGNLQALILRLTLNVTNNNPTASEVFARETLMALLGQVIAAKFEKMMLFMTEDDFSVVFDHLLLALGVMINFGEWSSSAREKLHDLEGKENDPLQSIVQIFVDNAARMSEADSVEESQKNVAFGYLSVVLGYFCLLPELSQRIVALQPRKSLRTLVASIEEFIMHHKAADILIEADEDGHKANTGLTERLESLVWKLSVMKDATK